jgi:dipeptidase E
VKFLLTSGGVRNSSIDESLVDLLGKPIAEANALCIPTALYAGGGPGRAWQFISGHFPTPLTELGWKSLGVLELTALPSLDRGEWVALLEQTDALLVSGGDSMYLCHWLRESGVADLLPTLRETVYVGVSAGSMVVTPSFGTAYDDWFCREPPVPANHLPVADDHALGLVSFSIFPHVDTERSPQNSMPNAELWASWQSNPTYAIDDQTAVMVVDGKIDVISEGHWKRFSPQGEFRQD